MPTVLAAALAALCGLLVGSFLNVCIYRLPRDLSVYKPARSFCPHCERIIAWYDNVPLLSYALLHGRCRHCGAVIPYRYALVEALTAALFFTAIAIAGFNILGVKYCVFAAILIVLVFTDLEARILPDEFTLGGIVLGLVFAALFPVSGSLLSLLLPPLNPRFVSIVESAFAALFLGGILWLVGRVYLAIRGREGMGLGDVKMVAMIGAFLGLEGALMAVVAGSLLGAIAGLLFIRLARKDPATYELPFGAFLGIGALFAAFLTERAAAWYWGLGA